MATAQQIDWSQCSLVDVNPKVQSGVPVLRGTRVPVSAILDNADYGMSTAEISEQFEVPEGRVRELLDFVGGHRIARPLR